MPECDVGENNRDIPYNQDWLQYAIPISNGQFDKCFRYAPQNTSNITNNRCTADMFDTTTKIACSEFIYSSDEINAQTEVN